jgi:hypothetical protein
MALWLKGRDHLEIMSCLPIHFFKHGGIRLFAGAFHINAFYFISPIIALCNYHVYSLQRTSFIPGEIIKGEIAGRVLGKKALSIIILNAVGVQLRRQKNCRGPVELIGREESSICPLTYGPAAQDSKNRCIDVPDLGLQKIRDGKVLGGHRICFRRIAGCGLWVVVTGACQKGYE